MSDGQCFSETRVLVVMGVAGSGKTTIGEMLAHRMRCSFSDADEFHSAQNKAKMSEGIPLSDEDRLPWLQSLHDAIASWLAAGKSHVLACSALRQAYRDVLSGGDTRVLFVFLKASPQLVEQRLALRKKHYMKANMVVSQFDALEAPSAGEAITVDAEMQPEQIVRDVLEMSGLDSFLKGND